MSGLSVSRKAQGALAVLAILLLALVGGLFFVKAEADAAWSAVEAKAAELEALRQRMRTGGPRPQGATVEGEPFLEGATYALAANALQQRIVGLVEASGGILITVGVERADALDDAGRRVTVQATAELSNNGLQQVLYSLEAEQPLLFVDSLAVTPARGSGAEGQEQKPRRLSVDLRVSGYYREAGR